MVQMGLLTQALAEERVKDKLESEIQLISQVTQKILLKQAPDLIPEKRVSVTKSSVMIRPTLYAYIEHQQQLKKHKKVTLQGYCYTVDTFLKYLDKRTCDLAKIHKTDVIAWCDVLISQGVSASVRRHHCSRLGVLFDFAKDRNKYITSDNPFRGINHDVKNNTQSYQPFSAEQLQKLMLYLKLNYPEIYIIAKIGIYTGMRIREITNLRAGDIVTIEGVLCFNILQGKNRNAIRLVPVHKELKADIQTQNALSIGQYYLFSLAEKSARGREDGNTSHAASQLFNTQKRKALLGKLAPADRVSFHSLRVMFITALDMLAVPEDRIAALVGHERGSTMSLQLYSKALQQGKLVRELNDYVQKLTFSI